MTVKTYSRHHLWWLIGLLLFLAFVTACQNSEEESSRPAQLQTRLLVEAPDAPLPRAQPVTVRSLTQDPRAVSHVELYAVQLPSGESNVLLRSDAAPFAQTSFTVSQTFTPELAGRYVIKVVGYNMNGDDVESNFIGFDVQ